VAGGVKEMWNPMALTKITPTPARVQWDRRLARPSTVSIASLKLSLKAI
jgi:hypothetical protein